MTDSGRPHPDRDRVIFCGSRGWTDRAAIRTALDMLPHLAVIVHGGAKGADSIAEEEAEKLGRDVEVYRADWKRHGRAAGPIRNQRMLDESDPAAVFAFRCPGHSPGTDDMVRRARARGVQVYVVEEVKG